MFPRKAMNFESIISYTPKLVAFCRNGYLLRKPFQEPADTTVVINDALEAMRICFEDDYRYFESWQTLCEREFLKTQFDCPHWLPRKIDQFLVTPLRERTCNESLVQDIPFIWDAIQQDFLFYIGSQNSRISSDLFTRVNDIYLSSGWPCGWMGTYPEGKLVVYSRDITHKDIMKG